jgi:hypothetical protein
MHIFLFLCLVIPHIVTLSMEDLRKSLLEIIDFVDTIISDRLTKRRNQATIGVPWKEDLKLKNVTTDLRSQAEIVSHSCIKLALLINTSGSSTKNLQNSINTLCEEMLPQLSTFYNIFAYV